MRLACLFTACALLVGCSPDEPAPRDSGTAPAISADEARALEEAREHFLGLDFDGRFGWYRREVIGTDEEALWGAWLAERGEAEFLEAVALCRAGRWKLYGRALYELDDPRWVRLAAWCLDSTTPADAAAARAALLSRKGLALDWLDLHVEQLAPTEAALHAQLVAEAPEREDAGALPAPLSEAVVYGGLLREAREVQSGTATPAPTEEQPARGDALRGILALQCSSRRATKSPVSPSTTTSGIPPTRVATTARRQLIASIRQRPNGSTCEAQTTRSTSAKQAATSSRRPRKLTVSSRPSSSQRRFSTSSYPLAKLS